MLFIHTLLLTLFLLFFIGIVETYYCNNLLEKIDKDNI